MFYFFRNCLKIQNYTIITYVIRYQWSQWGGGGLTPWNPAYKYATDLNHCVLTT